MTPELTPALDEEPKRMSEFSRITGVFFEPAKAFADIAERPRWLVPLLLVILATVAFSFVYGQRVGWERLFQQNLENSSYAQQQMERVPPEQRAQQMRITTRIVYPIMYYGGPFLGLPVAYLLGALVLWGMASGLMSAGLRFKQVFSLVCYASLTTIIVKILAIAVVFLKAPEDINFMNPLVFNPAAFMDFKTANKLLYTVAMGVDLFALWTLVLEGVGLKVAAGRRLSAGGAAIAVAVPYVAMLLFFGSLGAMFS